MTLYFILTTMGLVYERKRSNTTWAIFILHSGHLFVNMIWGFFIMFSTGEMFTRRVSRKHQ